jgi:hypothetical protein
MNNSDSSASIGFNIPSLISDQNINNYYGSKIGYFNKRNI